ncbi:MAG TPA: hypothetical protein VGD78_07080 [Chthoniobacterales bacterium]
MAEGNQSRIEMVSSASGANPVLHVGSLVLATPGALHCQFLSGRTVHAGYEATDATGFESVTGIRSWAHEGMSFTATDRWTSLDADGVRLDRQLSAFPLSPRAQVAVEGVQFHLGLRLHCEDVDNWRFFAPGMLYSPDQWMADRLYSFSDHRLAYPLVGAYQAPTGRMVCLLRRTPAEHDSRPSRHKGDSRYLQRTDIGACGISRATQEICLHAYWPYHDGDRSASLDARGTPATAFRPVAAEGFDAHIVYEIWTFQAETYAEAVRETFRRAVAVADPRPPALPYTLRGAIELRLSSAQRTFQEWPKGGAGFILNFDPEKGYSVPAKAFGASFADHAMADSQEILEYGFTGRQLNLAYVLAERYPGTWLQRSRRVVDFFVTHLATPSGWLFTLYHRRKNRPLYACGDPDGPVMHYLGWTDRPGTYTRMMVEAAGDLLLNDDLHRSHGRVDERWRETARRFGDFLLAAQNGDGSWYRAYTQAGEGIRSNDWFGATERAAKSATAVPIPYLLTLADRLPGEVGQHYAAAAMSAAAYVIREHVPADDYRGGTLDNPNVVDKEAALITMRALLSVYERTGDSQCLDGATRAASLGLTWHSIWTVPNIPGTALDRAGVSSVGWGGINSVWGVGVTDIYTLFFLEDLVKLGRLTGDALFTRIAGLIAQGAQQILAHPGERHGFADIGMQPEGISFCDQGVDDGLITKGDTWGGLGWTYTAGTFGLIRYLAALDAEGLNGPRLSTDQPMPPNQETAG